MRGIAVTVAFLACLLGLPYQVLADEERGSFGFSLEVDGDGFLLNPTVRSVTITAVTAGSPAARAGIAVKDQIVQADGHAIVGEKAKDLEPLMKKQVGQTLILQFKRPNGEEYMTTLVAAPRSSKP